MKELRLKRRAAFLFYIAYCLILHPRRTSASLRKSKNAKQAEAFFAREKLPRGGVKGACLIVGRIEDKAEYSLETS